MTKKSKHKTTTSGYREVASTGKSHRKREQALTNSSASSWLGNIWTLIRTFFCLKSIIEWGVENFPC